MNLRSPRKLLAWLLAVIAGLTFLVSADAEKAQAGNAPAVASTLQNNADVEIKLEEPAPQQVAPAVDEEPVASDETDEADQPAPAAIKASDDKPLVNPNIFGKAIDYAQRRCVKIYGAGIALEHGYATGIIVSDDGLILTAFGLYVSGEKPTRVVLPDGRQYQAEILRRSERIQTVLLKLKSDNEGVPVRTTEYFEVSSEEGIAKRGDWVLAIGNPYKVATDQEPLSANLGVVSMRADVDTKKKAQDQDIGADILLIDAITSNPGAPGGALVTVDGKLAGMVGKVVESSSTNTRINYAIPSDILRKFLDDELLEEPINPTEITGKATVGIRLFDLAGDRAQAYIDRVRRRSPADKAGLKRDDLILAIGDYVIYDIRDYEDALAKLAPGSEVPFVIKRKDEILVVNITPDKEEEDE